MGVFWALGDQQWVYNRITHPNSCANIIEYFILEVSFSTYSISEFLYDTWENNFISQPGLFKCEREMVIKK